MAKAYVLMTAMPPTTGHLQLIQFAYLIADDGVVLIISTQPHEPFAYERVAALRAAIARCGLMKVTIQHLHKTLEQDPHAPGFWNMWHNLLTGYGITARDIIVSSEQYGQKLAKVTGAVFFPYDIERCLNHAKATPIRDDPFGHFADILPEFRPYLQTTVTIFGAESNGKTTLSRALSQELDATWLFEYARPYLENTINEITQRSMTAIWHGQTALQKQGHSLATTPYIIQDTDLYSTAGYWRFPHWQAKLGECPAALEDDAISLASDLYIITKSNIPFEADPLRYGGDVREGDDAYWIGICERYNLPYLVLEADDLPTRLASAKAAISSLGQQKARALQYDRKGF